MSSRFRYDCAQRGCYNAALPNWDDILTGVFPRNIWPTDIDGMVEVNDHFLFMEQKGSGVSLTDGQRMAFRRLSSRARITVLFLRPGATKDYNALVYDDQPARGWEPCSKHQLRAWLTRWARNAEAAPRAG